MFSYIKMMGEGIYHVIALLTFSDPSGERPVHWQQHFLTKKTCPSSPSLIFHTQSSASCCYYLAHVQDKHSYQFRNLFLIFEKIEAFRSHCVSSLFLRQKYFVLCTASSIYFLIFNVVLSQTIVTHHPSMQSLTD